MLKTLGQRGGRRTLVFLRAAARRRWVQGLGLAAALLMAVAVGSALYYYGEFYQLIHQRLGENAFQKSAIYSRPYSVRKGEPLSMEVLTRRLDLMGYHRASRPAEGLWYQVDSDHKQASIGYGSESGTGVPVQVSFSDAETEKVTEIWLHGQAGDAAELAPVFLSNVVGSSREKRRYLRYLDIPVTLREAVIAVEDERYYSHHGLDLLSIGRAALVNLKAGGKRQGASTLTQQFVKNYFLSPEKTFKRKLVEAYMSVLMELQFSKEQIFEFYANEVYLGQSGSFSIVGLGEAANVYFGKNVKDLSVSECALLAGMIRAPNRYTPYNGEERAVARRNEVLGLMYDLSFINRDQMENAREEDLDILPPQQQKYGEAPYFVDYVQDQLSPELAQMKEQITELEVVTTMDADLQQAAFEAIQTASPEMEKQVKKRKIDPQVALVALNPKTGEILAMIGGKNYTRSQFNRAVQAKRQPGSTFKPFVYAAALESRPRADRNYTLSTLLTDEPYTYENGDEEYSPGNYNRKYQGLVSVRKALMMSLNVPTVRLAEEIGFRNVAKFSDQLGFQADFKPYPSLALGTVEVNLLELAQAYTVFANQGKIVPVKALRSITVNGQPRDLPPTEPRKVISPQVAFLVNSALESVINEGTGYAVRRRGFKLPAAGKTGTSNDSWFVGYTPDLLCAVWVGLDDATSLDLTGAEAALPIWTTFMLKAQSLGFLSGEKFKTPKNIEAVRIDSDTGLRASALCEHTRTEYYVEGTAPEMVCLGACRRSMIFQISELQDGRTEVMKR